MAHYDVIILGGGRRASIVPASWPKAGNRVAIVERELVGGECSYWACMPSKTLLRPGEALMDARRAPGAAEAVCRDLDVEAALGWRDYIVSGYDDSGAVKWAQENGIDIIRGEGRIAAPRHDRRGRRDPHGRRHRDRHRVRPGDPTDRRACATWRASGRTAR